MATMWCPSRTARALWAPSSSPASSAPLSIRSCSLFLCLVHMVGFHLIPLVRLHEKDLAFDAKAFDVEEWKQAVGEENYQKCTVKEVRSTTLLCHSFAIFLHFNCFLYSGVHGPRGGRHDLFHLDSAPFRGLHDVVWVRSAPSVPLVGFHLHLSYFPVSIVSLLSARADPSTVSGDLRLSPRSCSPILMTCDLSLLFLVELYFS